jgi:hypothetical protein
LRLSAEATIVDAHRQTKSAMRPRVIAMVCLAPDENAGSAVQTLPQFRFNGLLMFDALTSDA